MYTCKIYIITNACIIIRINKQMEINVIQTKWNELILAYITSLVDHL